MTLLTYFIIIYQYSGVIHIQCIIPRLLSTRGFFHRERFCGGEG